MHYCGLYFEQLCTRPSLREIKAKLRASSTKVKGSTVQEPAMTGQSKKESDGDDPAVEKNDDDIMKEFSDLIKDQVDKDTQRLEGACIEQKETNLKTEKKSSVDISENSKAEVISFSL